MQIVGAEAKVTKGYLRLPKQKVMRLIKTSVGEIYYFARDIYKILGRPENKYLTQVISLPDEFKMVIHPWAGKEETWVNVVTWDGVARLGRLASDNDLWAVDDMLIMIEDAAADPNNILWEQTLWSEDEI